MTAPPSEDPEATLELKFTPNSAAPTLIRRFVEGYYGQVLPDADLLYRVAMAAHEFMENAVKYSLDGSARFTIELRQGSTSPQIKLSLSNRAGSEHMQELEKMFAEMESFTDAFEHYKMLMKRPSVNGSGLGLARIRAEGQMRLKLVHEGDRICLQAEADIDTTEP